MGDHGDITSSEVPLDASGKTYHLCVDAQNIAKKIFIVGDPARVDSVAKYFDEKLFEASNREIRTITGMYKGQKMTVISTGIGTDNVEIVLTELHILNEYDIQNKIWKTDFEPLTIIRLGTCGGPQPDVEVGVQAITSYAIGLDNTGVYYPHEYTDEIIKKMEEEFAKTEVAKIHPYFSISSPDVVKALEEAAQKIEGAKTVTGITASASGFYAPQGRKVGRLGNILIPNLEEIMANVDVNGIKVVSNEMESSCLNRLCNILNYRSGTICLILAARAEGKQKFIDNENYGKKVDECVRIGLEAMHSL